MGRNTKNKRLNSNVILAKKSRVGKGSKSNPFEVHVNQEKFAILGRNYKHGSGKPGVSRGKAIKKRKKTLGQEYKELHKTNKFQDNRIGKGLFSDDAASARFTAEKIRHLRTKKKNSYNLNDDEILTHHGQTLEEIEQFHDPGSDDSEDNEILNAEFTEAVHFGGEEGQKNRVKAIEEMIAETKRRKVQIAKERDEVLELTQKLDQKYKSVIPLIGKLSKTDDMPKPKQDDYNRIMREMIFEPRGEVTDRLKSREELIKQEREQLEKLERERLARMNNEEIDRKPEHRSADALDDGFYIEFEDNAATFSYDKDGNSFYQGDSGAFRSECKKNGNIELAENAGIDVDDDESNEEDNLSDLEYDSSTSSDEEESTTNAKEAQKIPHKESMQNFDGNSEENIRSKELPHVFDMPESYEDFYELLKNESPDNQSIIVDRIIKCNHPKFEAANRRKMITFFVYLLQYVNDIFDEVDISTIQKSFIIFNSISPFLYDLVQLSPEKTSYSVLEVIKEKYNEYKKRTRDFPSADTMVFFKVVSNIFSTSDFRHPVVTPSIIFISHVLSRAKVRNRCDVAAGLFVATVALEYIQLSKRFLPAVLNYFLGIIFLAVPRKSIETLKIVPPFASTGAYSNILVLEQNLSQYDNEYHLQSKDFVLDTIDNDFKIRALDTTFRLITDVIGTLIDNVGISYFAESYLKLLERININNYPAFAKENYKLLEEVINSALSKPLSKLVAPERKPKILRMYDPLIKTELNNKKRPKLSKRKEMQAILQHKIKRETKGAVREIRRDTAFLTKLQIKKRIQSDTERKEKVQRIFAEASMQQGELNALARKNKKFE